MSTVMAWQTRSTSSDDTESLGELLGKQLKGGEVIELRSDLGGGKTTLVRGLVRGVGSKDTVTSPTFTLNKIYKAKNGLQIHHYDFYRLEQAGLVAEQLAESLKGPKNIVVVEWSDIVKGVLPKEFLTIEFLPVAANPDERNINFNYPEKLQPLVARLETDRKEVKP